MKYILIASLLTFAAYAAPFAQVNANAGQQTRQQGGLQQGAQTGQTGQQNGQTGSVQNGQAGLQTGQTGLQNGQNTAPTTNAPQTGGLQNGQTPSAEDLATAVSNWQADTSMVSNFLNTGPTIQNNVAFKQAATVAFNAEVDELTHKAIIDAANGNQPDVIAANSTLATGGSFQDVVDKLQEMSVKGLAASNNIDLINQNRCVNVLPNIDAYMASTGSNSQAIRPTTCDQTGVAGGVQGTGPTQPGQPAGSPAAAFAAAQDLAAGAGNGLVQNGAAQGNAGTAPAGGQQAGQQAGQQTQNQGTAAQDMNQGTAQGAAQGNNGQDTTQDTAQGSNQGTAQGNGQGTIQGTNSQGQNTGASQGQGTSQTDSAAATNGQSQRGQAGGA